MVIYPAIDLYDGKAVRLYKGDYSQMTVYNENPVTVALDFQRKGASHIHLGSGGRKAWHYPQSGDRLCHQKSHKSLL